MIAIVAAITLLVAAELRGALNSRKGDTISELWWAIRDRTGGTVRLGLDAALLVALVVAWTHLTLRWP